MPVAGTDQGQSHVDGARLTPNHSDIIPCIAYIDTNVSNALRAARAVLGLDVSADDSRVVKYSPTYKLVISLLNENSAAGDAVLGWEIEALLEREPGAPAP